MKGTHSQMNILIFGAQFGNKGAQSMLFITVDEMMKRFPNSSIYFATSEKYPEEEYTFKRLYISRSTLKIALGGIQGCISFLRTFTKDCAKKLIGRDYTSHYFDLKKIAKHIDIIIDISGYALGTKWPESSQNYYLDRIEYAKKNHIPIYIMPQSFGPFDNSAEWKDLNERITNLLTYPVMIFAREEEGYQELVDRFHLKNVYHSSDLVLQNKGINLNSVYVDKPDFSVPHITEKKVVGIVPNVRCTNHGDEEEILQLYYHIIKKLNHDGYMVILLRHSREDLELAVKIKAMFMNEEKVEIEEREFSCLEYDEYIKQFSFLVCSRYHGIVHAYRNGIPCIALGWAVKYKELTKCVGQEYYSFDITSGKKDEEKILNAIADMEENLEKNCTIIKGNVIRIQNENCFDYIRKL